MQTLKIAPAEREDYVALCSTEAGFVTVERLFAAKAPLFGPSSLDGRTIPNGQAGGDRSPAQLAAAIADYIRDRAAKGEPPLPYGDAAAIVLARGA